MSSLIFHLDSALEHSTDFIVVGYDTVNYFLCYRISYFPSIDNKNENTHSSENTLTQECVSTS